MNQDLDSLTADALQAGASPVGARPPQKMNYTHDACVDMLVTHPELTQRKIAEIFGYSEAWLSTIICSDAFQARLAQRREEVIDPLLRLTVEERFKAAVNRSFEVLMEKMSGPASLVSDSVAIRVAEMGGKVLAVRAANSSGLPPMPPGERLKALAGRLRELQRQPQESIDVVVKEVPDGLPQEA
jgi:hypothetical protein